MIHWHGVGGFMFNSSSSAVLINDGELEIKKRTRPRRSFLQAPASAQKTKGNVSYSPLIELSYWTAHPGAAPWLHNPARAPPSALRNRPVRITRERCDSRQPTTERVSPVERRRGERARLCLDGGMSGPRAIFVRAHCTSHYSTCAAVSRSRPRSGDLAAVALSPPRAAPAAA